MKIIEITCKTALSKSKLPGLDYSLNTYIGCEHNCAYCYAPNILRIKRDIWGKEIKLKKNIPLVLSKELKKKKPGVVGISTVTDPYQPIEKKYKLTRFCLEQILKFDFPVCIQTKSNLILRDMELIKKLSNAEVMMSIGTINDDERKMLEPNSSPIESRLKVLKELKDTHVKKSIFFGPIYPTVEVDHIKNIIETFSSFEIDEIMIDKLHLKSGISDIVDKKRFNDVKWYEDIREEIKIYGKKNYIKIVDAF